MLVRLGILGWRYGTPEGVTLERCHPIHVYWFRRVLARVGRVAYRLDLLEELSQSHSTHVSQLRKFLVDDFVVGVLVDIQVDDRLNYIKRPVTIIDKRTKTL